jgi:hypothetical protein
MDLFTAPDPLGHLPRDAYYHLIFTLRATLPAATDSPEALAWRDHAAIAQVAALCPANAAEAALAGQYVAANAQAMACLQLTRDPDLSSEWVLRCTAQAAAMMRQAQGAFRLLTRTQADRRKLEADANAASQAAWAEHIATEWMAQAIPDGGGRSRDPGPPDPDPAEDLPPAPPPRARVQDQNPGRNLMHHINEIPTIHPVAFVPLNRFATGPAPPPTV